MSVEPEDAATSGAQPGSDGTAQPGSDGTAQGSALAGHGGAPVPDTPARREAACCRSEPECLLCPLAECNGHLSLQQLWDMGLYANLPRLGFR